MNATVEVLLAIARELAAQARGCLPKMRKGEEVVREWYELGNFYRETVLNNVRYISSFDFRQKKSRLTAARVTDSSSLP